VSQPKNSKYAKLFRKAADYVMRLILWLVPDYIPLRNITIFHGPGERASVRTFLESGIPPGLLFTRLQSTWIIGELPVVRVISTGRASGSNPCGLAVVPG
jgi:hypothetical protein